MNQISSCWCGSQQFQLFSKFYRQCASCGTLVSLHPLAVMDREEDFYGREYWFSHQTDELRQPDIVQRARQDLSERCIHWLHTVLKYKLPPARILELGCSHGGFVALLRLSGFEATGLEVNSWVVEFARKTFQIPALLGPVEQQSLEPNSLDMIILMDVFEHFPDPQKTVGHCLGLLKSEGILLIQTPDYRGGKTYEEMVAADDPFLEQLKEKEHIFLFSRRSIRDFFVRLGAPHVGFEPAIFAHYDMFLAVSREPLTPHSGAEIEAALQSSPPGRMVLALFDLYRQNQGLLGKYQEAEVDRSARLEKISELSRLFQDADGDRRVRLEKIKELSGLLQEADGDRRVRLEKIKELSGLLQEANADRTARLDQIHELTRLAKNLEADRVSGREEMDRPLRRLQELEGDQAARLAQIDRLNRRLQESENVQAAQREEIHRLQRVQRLVGALYGPRVKRILGAMGLLGILQKKILGPPPPGLPPEKKKTATKREANPKSGEESSISCIAVDLTPLLPGVENGGAKLLALELVRHLAKLLPACQFVLLTSDRSHEELAHLDGPNVRRLCIEHQKTGANPLTPSRRARLGVRLREWLAVSLPDSFLARLRTAYRSLRTFRRGTSGVLRELGADLLFCPFTMPFYHDPAIPTVSIIYDLQYHYYPQFFRNEDCLAREYHFKETCRLTDRLICISEFVRRTVLENSSLPPEHVVSIPIRLLGRLEQPGPDTTLRALAKHGLAKEEFLLYPANFWAHKNHSMLFTAFGMFHSRHPGSKLRLVCTGSPDGGMEALREAIRRMGLEGKVLFPGFLPDAEFAALLASCRALIFPSLYEGFGMPVLEAMAFGKPVLCSNLSSIPEVAGDAALLFDPKKPHEILAAVERILRDADLVSRLITRGTERAATWGDGERMAREYSGVFHDALNGDRRIASGVHGLYSDGWTQERVIVAYDACPETRLLEMVLELPPVQPSKRLSVRVSDEQNSRQTYLLTRGNQMSFRHPLSKKGGFVEFRFNPSFQPKECGMNEDQRWLGCLVRDCAILTGTQRKNLLEKIEQPI